MRRGDEVQAARVGIVLALAIVVFGGGIWILGSASRIWSSKNRFLVRFNNVQGLAEGSVVSVAGFTIGTVGNIELPHDIAKGTVEIELRVDKRHSSYVREDTRARIKTIGLLGDKYIDLKPGTPGSRVLRDGEEIQVVQPPNIDSLMAQGESVADNLVVLTANLRRLTEKMDRGEGFLGALISNTEEGERIANDLKAMIASLKSVGEKADSGPGLLPAILNDEKIARDLSQGVAALGRVARSLEKGDGLAGRLLNDRELGQKTADDIREAARSLRAFTDQLHTGDGPLPRLVGDGELGTQVARDLREAAADLSAVLRRLREGEGSLGKLMVDETLYRGLNDILAGAQKSRLTRWFVARSQKRGVEEREKWEAQPAPGPALAPAPSPAPSPRK